jgi:hypothetical protein
MSVGVYIKRCEAHAEMMNHLSRNFYLLFDDPDIGLLTKDEMKLLLKHKYLNVTQEDQVLKAVVLWATAKLNQLSDDSILVQSTHQKRIRPDL